MKFLGGNVGEELVEAGGSGVEALTEEDLKIEGLVGLRYAFTDVDWSPVM
jgi:hypothetical protein